MTIRKGYFSGVTLTVDGLDGLGGGGGALQYYGILSLKKLTKKNI
jgi:hypothetical protein